MKNILLIIIFCFINSNISAQDIIKTLSDAFKNNSKLNAERAA